MSHRLLKRAAVDALRKPTRLAARVSISTVESLEQRLLFAAHPVRTISGHVFNDLNGNGTKQAKEHWLAEVTVFLDTNANGVQDAGEPSTTTNKQGLFAFHKLPKGLYDVVIVPPSGDVVTTSNKGAVDVNVTKRSVTSLRFGVKNDPNPPPGAGKDIAPPAADLSAGDISAAGFTPYRFSVAWTDATAVDVSTLGDGNLYVSGPGNFIERADLAALDLTSDGSPRTATYQIAAPSSGWTYQTDGIYTVQLNANQVADTLGNIDGATSLGTFNVQIPIDTPGTPDLLNGVNNATADNNASSAAEISFDISNTIPGAMLTLEADGSAIGSANVTSQTTAISTDGKTPLTDGAHQFSVTQTLSNGSESTSAPVTITVDTAGPTATLNAMPITTAGSAAYTFTVTYADATAVSYASLNSNDLLVTTPTTQHLTPTLVSVNQNSDGPSLVATYSINPPGGSWNGAENGSYTVTLQNNAVFDEVHNASAGRIIGTFTVSIGQALSPSPQAPVLGSGSDSGVYNNDDITRLNNSSGGSKLTFTVGGTQNGAQVVLYADGTPIGSANAGGGGTTTISTNGSTALSDGTHLITASQTVPGDGASTPSLALGIVIDTQPPQANSSPAPVNGFGATSYTFSVTYSDNIAINTSSLGNGDIVVAGPNGFNANAALLSLSSNNNGSPRTATYAITPPGGSWAASDNGTYSIQLQGGPVSDTAGNPSPAATLATFVVNAGVPASPAPGVATLAPGSDTGSSNSDGLTNLNNASPASALTFDVANTTVGATITIYCDGSPIGAAIASGGNTAVTTTGNTTIADGSHTITARQTIPGDSQSSDSAGTSLVIDTTPPTVTNLSAPTAVSGATFYTFTVTYADSQAVDVTSLSNGNIVVNGPGNTTLPAAFVSANPNANGPSISANYQITPPGGSWTFDDNGKYTIALQGGQVKDTAGNAAAAGSIGSFNVNMSQPVTAAPSAPVLSAATDSGSSDNDGITNLNNSSPQTALQFIVQNAIPGATVTIYANGSPIAAAVAASNVVTVTSTGNTPIADGTITLTARQQSPAKAQSPDSSANTIIIDTQTPSAQANLTDITTPGNPSYTFTITYTDNVAIDPSTMDNDDIVVSGPNGYVQTATLVSIDNAVPGPTRTATYSIMPPDGAWSSADDGTYLVQINAASVADVAGNFVVNGTLGTFNVTL